MNALPHLGHLRGSAYIDLSVPALAEDRYLLRNLRIQQECA